MGVGQSLVEAGEEPKRGTFTPDTPLSVSERRPCVHSESLYVSLILPLDILRNSKSNSPISWDIEFDNSYLIQGHIREY